MSSSNGNEASLLDSSSCGSAPSPSPTKESPDSQFTKVLWQSKAAGSTNGTKSAAPYHDNHFQSMLKSNYNNRLPPIKPRNSGAPNLASQMPVLPAIVCLITFATVLSMLIIYMDTTEIRHQQFRLNMSRDYDLLGVDQDNPTLISYVREVHMKKYVNTPSYMQQPHHHPQTPRTEAELEKQWDFRDRKEWTPIIADFAYTGRPDGSPGVFVSSLTGANEAYMIAPWLAMGANWTGVVVEPDPRKYFAYRKQLGKRQGVDVIHACLSPNKHPKEVTLRGEEEVDSDVKINSVLGGDDDDADAWFHSRVKCFPLYTILMATNRTRVDVLSIGCNGQHLQILKTLPWERIHIETITLHFAYKDDKRGLVHHISAYLESKGYDFARQFGTNYIYGWTGLLQPSLYTETGTEDDDDD